MLVGTKFGSMAVKDRVEGLSDAERGDLLRNMRATAWWCAERFGMPMSRSGFKSIWRVGHGFAYVELDVTVWTANSYQVGFLEYRPISFGDYERLRDQVGFIDEIWERPEPPKE